MKKYNVIWFDDEWESLEFIVEKALLNGISLTGFTNSEEGIRELELNILKYDAAILDGIFFRDRTNSGTVTNDKALRDVAFALQSLSFKKKLPWFILSGQTSFTKEANPSALVFKGNEVYDKLCEEDLNKLWHNIKAAADLNEDTQLRHEFSSVFAICKETYIGEDMAIVLLDLIKEHKNLNASRVSENKLNAIRKVVEEVFIMFTRIGVIPEEIHSGSGPINSASKFLAGINDSFNINEEIAPPATVFLLRSILNVTQDGSHSGDDLKLRIDQFVKKHPTGYLYSSVLFQLLEVLNWAKSYVDAHPDKEKNKLMSSKKIDSSKLEFVGIIERDVKGNYFCGDFLLPFKRVEEGYNLGDKIQIFEFVKNEDDRTKNYYSKFAKKFSNSMC